MKSTIKKLSGTGRQLDITLSPEEVNKAINEVVSELGKTVIIPGFRKGKAPREMVYKRYQETAVDEAKKRLVPETYQDALDEHKIIPVSLPELNNIGLCADGALKFTARVDVHPEMSLRSYRGIKVSSEKISVSGEEVEKALSGIRNMYAEFVDADKAVAKGDYAVCDIEMAIGGSSAGKKRENIWIEASKEASMFGIGEALCGMVNGETKTIKVMLPADYPDKKYASKEAEFALQVRAVKEKKLPDMDDELAKKAGEDTLEALRDKARSQLLEKKESDNRINMKRQVEEFLLKKNSLDLPESMVKRQFEFLKRRMEEDLARKGVNREAIGSHEGEFRERLMEQARNKVKLFFIIGEVAVREGISVTEDELDDSLRALADHYGQKFENVKRYYEENKLIGGLEVELLEEKILDFMLTEAIVAAK